MDPDHSYQPGHLKEQDPGRHLLEEPHNLADGSVPGVVAANSSHLCHVDHQSGQAGNRDVREKTVNGLAPVGPEGNGH